MNHIEIYVSHLIKSREFYDLLLPKLGYRLYQEWSAGFSYRKDEHYIVFVQVVEKYASLLITVVMLVLIIWLLTEAAEGMLSV